MPMKYLVFEDKFAIIQKKIFRLTVGFFLCCLLCFLLFVPCILHRCKAIGIFVLCLQPNNTLVYNSRIKI